MSIFFYIILFLFLSFLGLINKKTLHKFNINYNPIQKIHKNYTPPLGGLIIVTCLLTTLFFYKTTNILFNYYILIGIIIILFVGVTEDIFGVVSAKLRFLIIFISSLVYCNYSPNLPLIEIPILGELINNNKIIQIFVFSLGLSALSNGSNMLDGVNGLLGLTLLFISFSLILINDRYNLNYEFELLLLSLGLTLFLCINLLFGKIFLGDAGAYSLSWVLGIITITIFSEENINSWLAVVILFYPLMEVSFSYFRRILARKNAFEADFEHLHSRVYVFINQSIENRILKHISVCLFLSVFWLTPFLYLIFFDYSLYLPNLMMIALLISVYVSMYFFFRK